MNHLFKRKITDVIPINKVNNNIIKKFKQDNNKEPNKNINNHKKLNKLKKNNNQNNNQNNNHIKQKEAIPKRIREMVWNTYNGESYNSKCYVAWCNNYINVFNYQVGHDIPESKGGTMNIENLRPICGNCNQSMGNKYTIQEWSKLIPNCNPEMQSEILNNKNDINHINDINDINDINNNNHYNNSENNLISSKISLIVLLAIAFNIILF